MYSYRDGTYWKNFALFSLVQFSFFTQEITVNVEQHSMG